MIHRMRNGDEAAIESFVLKYYPAIFRYCYYRAGDRSQGEDLTQETFYRFFKSFPNYYHKDKLVNYLYSIAGNLCRDYWRSEQNKNTQLDETTYSFAEDLDIDGKVDIERASLKLPNELQNVIYMHFFLEMKLTEIAEAEGISLSLVKYRLKRGKELMKKALSEEE